MKRFLPFLVFTPLLFWLSQPGIPVRGGHIEGAEFLTLEPLPVASTESTESQYETSSNFISPVFEAPHEFQLLGLNWQQSLPEGTAAGIEIRFRNAAGEWSEWEHIHIDQDQADHDEMESQWSYVLSSGSHAFQYKAELSTLDSSLTPKLADINFDYVDGGEPSTVEGLNRLVFDDNQDVISRSEWGADEAYLYASTYNLGKSDYENSEAKGNEYPDTEIIKKVDKVNGEELLWPLEYPKEVDKIFIHHTASTKDLDKPEQLIRSIYAYHAMTRGWGDIGYNYLIDSEGNVYEGRYGGEGVVAGHAAGYNTGSVGIALMGHFEETPITAEMMKSLMGLVYDVALTHDIDPDGSSTFRGENLPNIMGHRDVSATACPGEVTYDFMPEIIASVGKSMDKRRNMNFSDTYAYEQVGDHEMVSMGPEGSESVTIKLKNTGSKAWNKDTILTYDTNNDGVASIDKAANKAIATLKESSVSPGGTGTFTFEVDATLKGGMTHFDLAPLFDGTQKTTHYLDLTVYVEQPMIEFDLVSEDMPDLMKPGQTKTVTVKIKNEGNFTWLKTGDHPVSLKLSGSSSLTSKSTLASMEESSVKPGSTATFKFDITAPSTGGKLNMYVYPELKDSNAYLSGTVQLSTQTSETEEDVVVNSISSDTEFEPGEKKYLWVELQNSSTETWSNDKIGVDFDAPTGVKISSAYMRVRSLPAGATAKLFFQVTAPAADGTYSIKLTPTLSGTALLDEDYEFDITVSSTQVETLAYENPIRIKLTPDEVGTPIVTANKNFAVYGGDDLLQTFQAGSRIFIAEMSGKYTVGSSKGRFLSSDEIRIVPETGGIVQVLSMDQVPAWNMTLNDNQFRGTLEVRKDDDALILINELALEDYLKGIAEVANDAHPEKAKTILVLARTYAYFYMTQAEKFPGKPYHLDDDPDTSQKYLGYGFETRSANIVDYVEETEGEVVTYNDEVVKTPYFSQSPGYTLSAQEKWGWTDTPWLQAVQDPYCEATSFSGHGVGLSGCGATAMAEAGSSYEEIIDYYYSGVELDVIE